MGKLHLLPLVALLVAALGVAVLGAACGAAEAPTPTATKGAVAAVPTPTSAATPTAAPKVPKRGGTLRHNMGSPPIRYDVLQSTSGADGIHMSPVYDALLDATPKGGFVPALAESWEVAPDGKAITLHLAKGVKFHDGTPFNAAAVKNDLEYKLNPANNFDQRFPISAIKSIDVPGEYDLKLNLSQVSALVLPGLASRPGMVFSPTARDALPRAERANKAVGAGSFKLVEFYADSHATVDRWPNGFRGSNFPYLDRMVFYFITDPAVTMASYRTGEVDTFRPQPDQRLQLKDDPKIKTKFVEGWEIRIDSVWLNPKYKPLDDVRVRAAMALAVNRDDFVQAIRRGFAVPVYGTIGPVWEWAFDPNYKKYAYDPEGAKKLLAEAGYPKGFTIGPVTWFGKEERLPIMNLLADQMKQVGIILELRMLESAQASREFRIEKKAAVYHTGWSGGQPDVDTIPRDWWYSRSPGFHYDGYLDPPTIKAIDGALDSGAATLDAKERAKWYQKAQDLIMDNHLFIPLFVRSDFAAVRDYVMDYEEFPPNTRPFWFKVWLDK